MTAIQLCFRIATALAGAIAAVSAMAGPAHAAPSGVCSEANVNAYLAQGRRNTVVDKARFYRAIRKYYSVYERVGNHYAGTDSILDQWNDDQRMKDDRWLAYILATAYHETAFRMFPVRETLASSDESAINRLENFYQRRGATGPVYWRPVEETGRAYFGRGYVQLTWDWNYKRADKRFGIANETRNPQSYYWNPDLALDPESSIRITYDGMIYGWYTGHCLLRHIQPNRRADYGQARRVINGIDKASKIAEHADHFMEALDAARVEIAPKTPTYQEILENLRRVQTQSGRTQRAPEQPAVRADAPTRPRPLSYAAVAAHYRRLAFGAAEADRVRVAAAMAGGAGLAQP